VHLAVGKFWRGDSVDCCHHGFYGRRRIVMRGIAYGVGVGPGGLELMTPVIFH